MLPKNRRIPRKLFIEVFKKSKILKNEVFLMRVAENKNNFSKFAASVSKKISKKAVIRNKLRRNCYSFLDRNLEEIKEGFFVHLSFVSVPPNNGYLVEKIKEILEKAKLIK